MKARRDPDTTIKSFLDEGLDELPERSYDAVRAAVDQTRQWAVIGPWKESQIMTATRFALIAAAIAVVAVVAIRFLPVGGGIGVTTAPVVTPSPTPSTTPSPSPTPTTSPLLLPVTPSGPQPLSAGTYSIGDPFPVSLTITVPAGWRGNVGGAHAVFLDKPSSTNNVSFTLNQSLYTDPCHVTAGFLSPAPGPSVDDFVSGLAKMKGLTSTAPTNVAIDGYGAKQVSLTSPTDVSHCDMTQGGLFRLWQLPLGATEDIGPAWTDRLSVVEINANRLVIQTSGPAGESAADKVEADAIINSLVFSGPN